MDLSPWAGINLTTNTGEKVRLIDWNVVENGVKHPLP
jgi:hypothetical protein